MKKPKSPDQIMISKERAKTINKCLDRINEKERLAFELRYFSEPVSTYEKIGEKLGVTRARAYQIIRNAQRKMAKYLFSTCDKLERQHIYDMLLKAHRRDPFNDGFRYDWNALRSWVKKGN